MPAAPLVPASARPYVVVWLVLVFAWTANFTIRVAFAALLPFVMRDLNLTYTRAGVLAAAFFYAYALGQLPAGVLGDRFGRRRVLVVGLAVGAVACALTGFAASFLTVMLARLLTGGSHASLFSNDRAIIASVTPTEKMALGQALSFTGPGLGLMLGLGLGGVLADRFSWRVVCWLFALGPLAAAVLVRRFVPLSGPRSTGGGLLGRLRVVLGRGDLWVLGAASACAIYVQFVLGTWGPMLFLEVGVRDASRAGLYAAVQGLAAVAGLVTGGLVADAAQRRGGSRKRMMAGSMTAVALAMLAMTGVLAQRGSPFVLGVVLFLGSFFVWSTWGPAYALIGELEPGPDLATAFGLCNTVSFVGAMVGPMVTGWARDQSGSFAAGCLIAAVVSAVGAVIVLRVRPPGASLPRGAGPEHV
jgi:predicted MFS family arabinose efflux permease